MVLEDTLWHIWHIWYIWRIWHIWRIWYIWHLWHIWRIWHKLLAGWSDDEVGIGRYLEMQLAPPAPYLTVQRSSIVHCVADITGIPRSCSCCPTTTHDSFTLAWPPLAAPIVLPPSCPPSKPPPRQRITYILLSITRSSLATQAMADLLVASQSKTVPPICFASRTASSLPLVLFIHRARAWDSRDAGPFGPKGEGYIQEAHGRFAADSTRSTFMLWWVEDWTDSEANKDMDSELTGVLGPRC
ncbi:hypothetical protein E2P81_ATG08668 [Venturia nashicola]|uniref:Uncharacterized protein n=1 Tax=Venturia nashicola TaxID=86259 RepID=A0A4Z1NH11_9PEZI|nr:hypothetical protein E6O75_ATG08859 [Venturia nashicola]TLD21004.1 hypothetical protein E2P81_ATG08668 [Venturia nashicola]